MDENLLSVLQSSKIFSSLSKRTCRRLFTQFEKIELHKNEILFSQGDAADFIYILLSGSLSSILTTANGEQKTVGSIEPGEVVGELGALSNEARPVTVKALTHTILLKLPNEVFVELCRQYPSVMLEIVNPVITHSQKIIQLLSPKKFRKNIALIPANHQVDLTIFLDILEEHLSSFSSIVLMSDYKNIFDNATPDTILHFLEKEKEKNIKKIRQKFLYLLKSQKTPLAEFCFDRIDMVYIIANSNSPPVLDNYVTEKIQQFLLTLNGNPELILLHPDGTERPLHTAKWLQITPFALHHHIRLNYHPDYRRLIRFIREKAIGLVLGGGGTRGWAHIGAIKALIEAGIPIDAIGGNSVGAIIAACYAMTNSVDTSLNMFRDLIYSTRDSTSWRNLTWPIISIFNAKSFTDAQRKLFHDILIEDLWLPYFCVSFNLSTNSEAIHRQGNLYEKIRASTSVPGLVPPMVIDGELHLDGLLVNNLPIDVMKNLLGAKATIIAVDLSGYTPDKKKYDFPPILTFSQTLLARLGLAHKNYTFPNFIETFLKILLASSMNKTKQNSLAATILVTLDLTRFRLLTSEKRYEQHLIDTGYNAMVQQIKQMTHKHYTSSEQV